MLAALTHADAVMNMSANQMMGTTMGVPTDATMCAPTSSTADDPTSAGVGTVMDAPMNDVMGTLADALQNAEIIEEGVGLFVEVVSPLVAALEEVAKIHPFIGGATLFYHTVLIVKYPV